MPQNDLSKCEFKIENCLEDFDDQEEWQGDATQVDLNGNYKCKQCIDQYQWVDGENTDQGRCKHCSEYIDHCSDCNMFKNQCRKCDAGWMPSYHRSNCQKKIEYCAVGPDKYTNDGDQWTCPDCEDG